MLINAVENDCEPMEPVYTCMLRNNSFLVSPCSPLSLVTRVTCIELVTLLGESKLQDHCKPVEPV